MRFLKKEKIFAIILAAMLILSSSATVFGAQEVTYTTNGAAQRYSAGSVLMLYGKVTDSSVPISNLAITIDIKDTNSKPIYFGQIKTDANGYFRTNFTVPSGVSGAMNIAISTIDGQKVNADYSLENKASFLLTGTIPSLGTSESSANLIPYTTGKIGLAFSANVNYFNNKNSTPSLPTVLGVNTRNEDCFTLYEKTATGYTVVDSYAELTDKDSAVSGITFFNSSDSANNKSERKNVIYLYPDSALKQNTTYKVVIDKDLSANNSATLGSNQTVYFKTSSAAAAAGTGSGTAQTTAPLPENRIEVQVKPTVDGSKATVQVTNTQLTEALKNVKEAENNIVQMTVAQADSPNATDFEFQISQTQATELKSANVGVSFNTPTGEVILPTAVLAQIQGDASIQVSKVEGTVDTFRVTLTDSTGKVKTLNGRTSLVFPTVAEGSESTVMTHDGVIMKNAVINNNQATGITKGFSEFAVKDNLIEYTDTKGHWAEKYITFLSAREIVNGVSADQFAPSNHVTRSQFVKMLVNSMDEITLNKSESSNFSDVSVGQWYSDYIKWATDNKVVSGYTDGTFGLNKQISRQEMAVMIDRFAAVMNIPLSSTVSKTAFEDDSKIADYAKASVYEMQQAGLISGKQNNLFDPAGNATRAEASKMITIMINKLLGTS